MKVIAHRGNSAHYPENTPAGWDSAFAHRAHAIEADIRFSADGVGICAHDPALQRLFKRDERTAELSYAELASLAGAQGETISLYTDVLAYVRKGQSVVLDHQQFSHNNLLFFLYFLCRFFDLYTQIYTHMHRISAAQAPENALVGWQRAWRLASRCVSARRLDETPCETAGLNAGEQRAQPSTWCARHYL